MKTFHLKSERQHGFLTGRSTDDALMFVKNFVIRCHSRYVLEIFLGFNGVFDYLNWQSVLLKLRERGCYE